MSTPIKPPGSAPTGGVDPGDPHEGVEGQKGEFRDMVGDASEAHAGEARAPARGSVADAPDLSRVADLRDQLAAGRIDADTALERLVERALAGAADLPDAHRASLEAQLRDALAQDPTLAALRKDLERASKG
jgi:hypothetical protein